MSFLDVVAGVIVEGGRILLCQRPRNRDYPFTWECPGGKIEVGETGVVALARELREELDLDATVDLVALDQAHVQRADGRWVEVVFHPVTIGREKRPRPLEGQGLGWFTPEEMTRLDLAPANQLRREEIAAWVRSQS